MVIRKRVKGKKRVKRKTKKSEENERKTKNKQIFMLRRVMSRVRSEERRVGKECLEFRRVLFRSKNKKE